MKYPRCNRAKKKLLKPRKGNIKGTQTFFFIIWKTKYQKFKTRMKKPKSKSY